MEKPRQIAFAILRRHSEGSEYLEDVIAEQFAKHTLAANDRALVHELTGGVVRWRRTLDWLIEWRTRGRAQQPVVRILLWMGFYQLLWLDRVPAHAAVHETVELAKSLGLGPIAGFINALCRSLIRELDEARRRLAALAATHPDIRFSHPEWLAHRWEKVWGRERVRVLMEWNNLPPPVYARVNRLLATPESLEKQWADEGVVFQRHEFAWAPNADVYELKEHPSLSGLKSLREGRFYVQDPSTLLAVHALDPQPGMTVLDSCAAPGGKTTLIAQRMRNEGILIAQDTHRARTEMIRQNCERLGVRCVRISTHSGVTHPELSLAFDRILVDAPCSNTGVMRRRIDLRWRVSPEEIQRLQGAQQSLIENASTQLKPGGLLVYSTCSLEPEENQQVTQWFLRHNPEFESVFSRQLTPFEHSVDGAYVTVFRRRAPGA
ncbi:MAG: 16S rRNA (cytosine(967)-C(5))-methyltransferase RsmB [Verrucomicrobia bacterium]|nr:16S rRNA (cytosine(967)-C(5))-methyltransferase RsmB [Verrucomicrobiota bacterium]MBI3871330.1 16S rRNA (cytosine(967)-C(5))-methyltransferase RsmB [Verrucomicrobiota bacterium]